MRLSSFTVFAALASGIFLGGAQAQDFSRRLTRGVLLRWADVRSSVPAGVTPATPDNWVGGTGNWSTPGNWTGGLPNSSSTVTIGNTSNGNVTEDLASASAATLSIL